VVGAVAGTLNDRGYLIIRVDYQNYRGHRLAWFYITGEWPDQIDHIDMDKANNRWANLREATKSQNQANTGMSKSNTSGLKGVHLVKSKGRYQASIKVDGRQTFLGYYQSPHVAHIAAIAARALAHGKFARLA
jgi:HNH endonuclease